MQSDQHDFYIEEHAVLYGLLVREARAYGEAGETAAAEATRRYGRERGQRMAQRALRDGRERTMEAYTQYGEWSDPRGWSQSVMVALSPHYTTDVLRCGWCDSWIKHDLLEHGQLYCAYVDDSLVTGFNPQNSIEIQSLLSRGDDRCRFVWKGLHFGSEAEAKESAQVKKSMAERNIKDFLYHTAHLYASMNATFAEMLGTAEAKAITEAALGAFTELFGAQKTERLLKAAEQNFSVIDQGQ
jgi:hypothetical protein